MTQESSKPRLAIHWLRGCCSQFFDFGRDRGLPVINRRNVAGIPWSRTLQRMLMLRDTWYRRCLRNILPWSLCHAIEQAVIDPLKMLKLTSFP